MSDIDFTSQVERTPLAKVRLMAESAEGERRVSGKRVADAAICNPFIQ